MNAKHSNPQYIALNNQIDDLLAQLHAPHMSEGDDLYCPQAYEETAEALVRLENERDELLAGVLMERWNGSMGAPIDRARALELARYANSERDKRALVALEVGV